MWTQWVWLGRLVVTKKEIEAKEKMKLILSGIFARGDINKEEDIISTNNRLDKYWNRNEFFLSIIAILMELVETKVNCI